MVGEKCEEDGGMCLRMDIRYITTQRYKPVVSFTCLSAAHAHCTSVVGVRKEGPTVSGPQGCLDSQYLFLKLP